MALNSDEKRSILNELMTKQNCKCFYCQQYCFIGTIEQRKNKDQYPDIATIEHRLPPGAPERHHKVNLVMACNGCNNRRGRENRTSKQMISKALKRR